MNGKCKVLDLFDTSLGTIAILGFLDADRPFIGMWLSDVENHAWKISGIGLEKTSELYEKYNDDEIKSIWDCKMTANKEGDTLQIGTTMEILNVI